MIFGISYHLLELVPFRIARNHFCTLEKDMKSKVSTDHGHCRQGFIGGSDARIIMGDNEQALSRLWREKRGEIEPEDLSGNLIVQLGVATEELNRHWFERNTGH